ncbi:MAG TPA: gliding motility-associated ABC transporter ATP-binding subunit GldA [Bacteroidia bacterium]|nr:gliding motility-associated ABC transporter ATP-binding subunit GldA [Bacteroidia bacterium]
MPVKVSSVTKVYGKQKALDQVSFEVNTSQVIGFLGPNGAGKSTMMKIICCFIPQTLGDVSVNGHDTLEQSVEVRRIVGYLPEHNPLYLDMYVKEYLAFIAGMHKMQKDKIEKRVAEMIEITGLGLEQRKKIGALSRGYRQRVGLAQAMIHEPDVLILDEPTSGLDPNQLIEIRNLIKNIGKEKTVILSTHIMQEVEAICNRVIIINKGKIIADDDTAVLQQRMEKEKVFIVEFNKPVSRSELEKINGVASAENAGNNEWKIKSKDNEDLRPHLFQYAVDNQLTVLKLNMEEYSLEEVFHKLTLEN